VVDCGELDGGLGCGGAFGEFAIEFLDAEVEVEEDGAAGVVADHALDPEERAEAGAAGDGPDVVEAGGGVEDHVAGGELDALDAVGVLHAELAAVVLLRCGEKQRGGDVGADAVRGAGDLADGVIDMGAEGLAAGVAVEQGREYFEREGCGDEEGVVAEGFEDHLAHLTGGGVILGDLHVVLCPCGLMAGGDAAIDPFGFVEDFADAGDLVGGEDVGDGEEHGREKKV